MDREDQRFRVLGRAAASNDASRFERNTRVAEDDGWAREEVLPVPSSDVSAMSEHLLRCQVCMLPLFPPTRYPELNSTYSTY